MFCSPSRFIKEIDPQFLEMPQSSEEELPAGNFRSLNKPVTSFSPVKRPAQEPPKGFVPKKSGIVGSVRTTSQNAPLDASFVADDPRDIRQGMKVEHQRFGEGEVILMEGIPPDAKATVLFKQAGSKQLLLKFARLRILDSEF